MKFRAPLCFLMLALPLVLVAAEDTSTPASAVTPIYFYKEPAPAPVASKAAPEVAQAKSETKPAVTAPAPVAAAVAQAATDGATDDGSGDGNAVAPFPAWRLNAMSSFTGMHHVMKAALPVFTPDPPILHGQVPEPARGKDVVMEVMIDDQGSIVFAKVVQGVGNGVEQSIVETLRRWIFVPAKINGVAVASQRQLTFHLPG